METILFLAHTEADGTLAPAALEALGTATSLNTSLANARFIVGLLGENVTPAAQQIASCGAAKFLGVS